MRHHQRGFTLIEIAIVLVIIGLLLGGVLKGQELITQAKIKNVANDLNGVSVAVYAYQDRYKRLPGDDPGAGRWSIAGTALAAGSGNNVVSGTYAEPSDNAVETRMFWANVRMAGLIGGDTTTLLSASSQPLNAAGGITGVQQNGLGLSGLVVCSGSLPAKIAQAVDSQFDDGNATSGSVRGLIEGTPPTAVPAALANGAGNYVDNGANLYVICQII